MITLRYRAFADVPPGTVPVAGRRAAAPSVGHSNPASILLPDIAPIAGLPIELAGLLPNRDHNEDMLRGLDALAGDLGDPAPLVGLFAADPFLRVNRLAKRLAAQGLRDVVNLPSVAQYGADYSLTLNSLGIGPLHEIETLAQFKALGFRVSVAITCVEDLAAALPLQPRYLLAVPRFGDGASADARTAHLEALAAGLLEACRREGVVADVMVG